MSESSQPDPVEFQDPLENYEPKKYDDPLEEALDVESVSAIQATPFATAPATTTVGDAIARLADLHVACLMIEEEGKLVGVFSDRDAMNNAALEYDDVKDQPVSTVMTKQPVFVYETDSAAAVLAVMAISGYRHVPVLSLDGQILGIASPQRVTEFLRTHFGA